ncbi:MAG: hypothetical protein DSY43_01725 [Gammaproteobacteria bacterium]|nr:MAG: hypothetical protein DSY43_01725 [Gammaproteobacteria bacterium]
MDLKSAILNLNGGIITLRTLKQSGPRSLRSTSLEEFKAAAEELSSFGKLVSVRVARQPRPSEIFVKKDPAVIAWESAGSLVARDVYTTKYALPVHSSVGRVLKRALVSGGHVASDFFD